MTGSGPETQRPQKPNNPADKSFCLQLWALFQKLTDDGKTKSENCTLWAHRLKSSDRIMNYGELKCISPLSFLAFHAMFMPTDPNLRYANSFFFCIKFKTLWNRTNVWTWGMSSWNVKQPILAPNLTPTRSYSITVHCSGHTLLCWGGSITSSSSTDGLEKTFLLLTQTRLSTLHCSLPYDLLQDRHQKITVLEQLKDKEALIGWWSVMNWSPLVYFLCWPIMQIASANQRWSSKVGIVNNHSTFCFLFMDC